MGWTNMEKWTWISTTRQSNGGQQETLHSSGSNLSICSSKEYLLQREEEKVAKYRKLIENMSWIKMNMNVMISEKVASRHTRSLEQ